MSIVPTATERSPCPPGFSSASITRQIRCGARLAPLSSSRARGSAAMIRGIPRALAAAVRVQPGPRRRARCSAACSNVSCCLRRPEPAPAGASSGCLLRPAPERGATALPVEQGRVEGWEPVAERLGRAALETDRGLDVRPDVVAAVGVLDQGAEEGRSGLLDGSQDGVLVGRLQLAEGAAGQAGGGQLDLDQAFEEEA